MWWVWVAVAVGLLAAYLVWLAGRVSRLHQRSGAAAAALEAALVRRAAAAAVLADQLSVAVPDLAGELYPAARAALDAGPDGREEAENDLTKALRRLSESGTCPAPEWEAVVTASRRLGLARQVHTDVVRDALAVRRRPVVRAFGLARRYPEPEYFDVDPDLSLGDRPADSGDRPADRPPDQP